MKRVDVALFAVARAFASLVALVALTACPPPIIDGVGEGEGEGEPANPYLESAFAFDRFNVDNETELGVAERGGAWLCPEEFDENTSVSNGEAHIFHLLQNTVSACSLADVEVADVDYVAVFAPFAFASGDVFLTARGGEQCIAQLGPDVVTPAYLGFGLDIESGAMPAFDDSRVIMRLRSVGDDLRCKVWNETSAEPDWQAQHTFAYGSADTVSVGFLSGAADGELLIDSIAAYDPTVIGADDPTVAP